jgi:hypothetical protein
MGSEWRGTACAGRGRYSIYRLYWYKRTNTDAAAAAATQAASEMEVVSKDDDRKDANFKELKEVRTAMAQARLAELEERLNRLQLKTSLLKTKPDEPIGIMPDNWALPGTVDERHSNIMQTTADNSATVRPQKRSVCYCHPFASSHDLIV